MSSWILFLEAGWSQFSVRYSLFSEWALWGCLIAVFVFVLMIWIRNVKNGNCLRQRTALFAIFAINRFQKNIRFHIPNLNAVSDVQWVRMFDSSLPIRKLLFRGRRVLAETKTKVWTFAIFVPQWQEQRPTSIAGVEWDIEIHQMNCWIVEWQSFFLLQKLLPCLYSSGCFTKTPFFGIHIALSWLVVLGPNMDPNTAKYAKYSTWGA